MDSERQDDGSLVSDGLQATLPVQVTDPGTASDPPPSSTSEPLDRGATLGRYTVLDRLGSGGMGVVYTAYDPQLDRRIALKVLHPGSDREHGSGGRGRLLREAQAMAKLSHANVITVHDVGTLGDRVFVAMEFIDGTTLREWIRQPREWPEIVEAFVKAGRGLAAAHAAGLVHRDFKPDNVLVGRDGRVLVMDFGLARQTATGPIIDASPGERVETLAQLGDLVLTRTGALLGTPAYMAPEQHKGAPADPLADQFSFCVALYEALYGERPFTGGSVASVAMAILEGTIREPPKGTRIPQWLRDVVLRGLRVDPEDRFQSMDDLLAELQRDPPQAHRPWLGIGIAAGVATLITTAYLWSLPASEDRCTDAATAIATGWNDDMKQAIRAAMEASDAAMAETVAATVGTQLDQWARAWVSAHDEACMSSRVPGGRPITADDVPQLRCLDVARESMFALADVLTEPDPGLTEHAVIAAQHLPAPMRCATQLRLSVTERDPKANASAMDRVKDVRRQIARAWALTEIGRPDDALAIAESARSTARPLDDPGLLAEIHVAMADADRRAARWSAAERSLREAIRAAAQGQRAEIEAEAWIDTVAVVGHASARHAEALRAGLAADAAILRVDDEPLTRAALEVQLGRVHLSAGRWDAARSHFDRARRLRSLQLATDHVDLAETLLGLGLALDGLGRFEEAGRAHAEALATFERALGPRHPRVAIALAYLGTAELGVDAPMRADANFARASVILEPVVAAPEATNGAPGVAASTGHAATQRMHADVLGRAAAVRRTQERFADAEALHRRALVLLDREGEPVMRARGYARVNLGVVLSDQERDTEAVVELRRGLATLEATLDPSHPDLGIAQLDLGKSLWALSDHAAAHEAYARALAIFQDALPEDHPMVAYALTGLGRCAHAQGDIDEAIEHLDRAFELRDHDDEDKLNVAETALALGRALWATGRDPERALVLAEKARDYAGAYEPSDEDGLRAMLDGMDVPRLTDQLAPASLGLTNRDPLAF